MMQKKSLLDSNRCLFTQAAYIDLINVFLVELVHSQSSIAIPGNIRADLNRLGKTVQLKGFTPSRKRSASLCTVLLCLCNVLRAYGGSTER